jgi:hypothetical protein
MLHAIYVSMRTSCASWSSLDVMYTQPPHESVLMIPKKRTMVGRLEVDERARKY